MVLQETLAMEYRMHCGGTEKSPQSATELPKDTLYSKLLLGIMQKAYRRDIFLSIQSLFIFFFFTNLY